MLLVLFSLLLAKQAPPGDLVIGAAAVRGPAACSAHSARGREIIARLVGLAVHENTRRRYQVPRSDADRIRAMNNAQDSERCARMLELLEARAQAIGSTRLRTPMEFYEVGGHYFALSPLPPSRCRPRPGGVCVDLRWQAIDIFDHALNHVGSLAF